MESHADDTNQYVWLDGRPPVADFIRFMKRASLGGMALDEASLARQWAKANARVRELESQEAGWADTDELPELRGEAADRANAELHKSAERNGLAFLPYRWALVELDRLVVYQKFINITFAEHIKRSFPTHPSDEELIQIALGNTRASAPVHTTQIDGNAFSFLSASNDLRILRVAPFDAGKIADPDLRRNSSMVLGVFVGYSSNLLKAVRIGRRTILTNGSHRAYALRALGLTHVPCIVQSAREDQLDLLGAAEIKENFDRYVTAPRPALFKDYFDDRLHRIVCVHRRGLMLQVELTIRESVVPAF